MERPLFRTSSQGAGQLNDEVRRSGAHEAPPGKSLIDPEAENLPEFADQAEADAAHAEKVRMIERKAAEIALRRLRPRTAMPSRIDVPGGNPDDTKTGRKPLI